MWAKGEDVKKEEYRPLIATLAIVSACLLGVSIALIRVCWYAEIEFDQKFISILALAMMVFLPVFLWGVVGKGYEDGPDSLKTLVSILAFFGVIALLFGVNGKSEQGSSVVNNALTLIGTLAGYILGKNTGSEAPRTSNQPNENNEKNNELFSNCETMS